MTGPVDTWVINLARRPDRRASFAARARAAGIAHQWFDAVDAQSTPLAQLMDAFPDPAPAWPCLPGEMACALSHRGAWDSFLAGSARAMCVVEDDVRFGPALAALLADDGWITPAHGLVKLDLNTTRPRRVLVAATPLTAPQGTLWRLWSRQLGGGAYVAHREVVAQLRAGAATFRVPVDHYLFDPLHAPHVRSPGIHLLMPAPVWHDHDGSDLAPARANRLQGPDAAQIRRARAAEGRAALPGRILAFVRGARMQPLTSAAPR